MKILAVGWVKNNGASGYAGVRVSRMEMVKYWVALWDVGSICEDLALAKNWPFLNDVLELIRNVSSDCGEGGGRER